MNTGRDDNDEFCDSRSGFPKVHKAYGLIKPHSHINSSSSEPRCVTSLARVGNAALAHCLLKAFLEANHGVRPRRLALYCVPTRALREEVVLELIKFKALAWFSVVLLAVCVSLVLDSSIHFLNLFCGGGQQRGTVVVWQAT